jgi:hypothetical protein
LNTQTIKNAYPIPLISETINKLKGAKYFSKANVRWGYNNIQIKDGDQWKAAFKTQRGLFKPTITVKDKTVQVFSSFEKVGL